MLIMHFTAPLNEETHHMLNMANINSARPNINTVNVGRGPLVCEKALVEGHLLASPIGHGCTESEPISDQHSRLLDEKE